MQRQNALVILLKFGEILAAMHFAACLQTAAIAYSPFPHRVGADPESIRKNFLRLETGFLAAIFPETRFISL
ncbi:MAG TPA: hypothetical protein DCY88_22550 [Cyanobacteria bacterium UBA11372]|nr:hypothetical protein [Cyanobacteria bacterium UBA11372]